MHGHPAPPAHPDGKRRSWLASLLHGSGQPASAQGLTIGTPRLYEVTTAILFGGRRRASFETVVRLSGVEPGDRVLDVGCGSGYLTRLLAGAAGPGGTVLGIDAAPEMIAHARGASGGLEHLHFEVGAAEQLAAPAEHFDVVVSSLLMHHLPGNLRTRALTEMRRVLRPGGTLVLADFQPAADPPLGWRLILAASGLAEMGSGTAGLGRLVEEAGFAGVRAEPVPPALLAVIAEKP